MPSRSVRRAGGAALLAVVIVLCGAGVIGLSATRARRATVDFEEHAAATALKAAIFPAEMRFQHEAFRDQDGDRVGEFGALPELGPVALVLPPAVAAGAADGYRFAVWLPTGPGSAASGPLAADADGVDLRERRFLAYAWPDANGVGRTVFALDEDGRLYAAPAAAGGGPPAWDAALAEPRWGARVRWAEWMP